MAVLLLFFLHEVKLPSTFTSFTRILEFDSTHRLSRILHFRQIKEYADLNSEWYAPLLYDAVPGSSHRDSYVMASMVW